MIKLSLAQIFNLALALPAVIGLARWRKLEPAYHYFVAILWIGLINEITSILTAKYFRNNAVNNNIYVLVESIGILVFLYSLGARQSDRRKFLVTGGALVVFWIVENLVFSSLLKFNSYFRVCYSFVLVIASIQLISRLLIAETEKLNKGTFMILIGLIIFFTVKLLVEIFWIYGLNSSRSFQISLYRIVNYINLFVNFLYAIAFLCLPKKPAYS